MRVFGFIVLGCVALFIGIGAIGGALPPLPGDRSASVKERPQWDMAAANAHVETVISGVGRSGQFNLDHLHGQLAVLVMRGMYPDQAAEIAGTFIRNQAITEGLVYRLMRLTPDFATAMGWSPVLAAKMLSDALVGSEYDLERINKTLTLFPGSEETNILLMWSGGKYSEAANVILNALYARFPDRG